MKELDNLFFVVLFEPPRLSSPTVDFAHSQSVQNWFVGIRAGTSTNPKQIQLFAYLLRLLISYNVRPNNSAIAQMPQMPQMLQTNW